MKYMANRMGAWHANGRKPRKDLVIYEMNIFDFTAGYNREKEAGVRDNEGSMTWYQPYLISQFTSTAVPLVQDGPEFGEEAMVLGVALIAGFFGTKA